MYNIATIYRFKTPFLDIFNERDNLISVIKKIRKSIEFDWMKFETKTSHEWSYYKIVYDFEDNLWRIEFFYVKDIWIKVYHLPIFKLNIFLNQKFLLTNSSKQKTVKFVNNIFECFDWLNEKEFLIDIDNSLYYKNGIFSRKIRANYDFSDIEKIRESFESQDGMEKLEEFIKKFSNKEFLLTYSKSDYFHKLHWIFLYFVYLVFLMYQNLEKTDSAKRELQSVISEWVYESQIELMKNRLEYVEEMHLNTFEQYKNRLELFFKMF